MKNEKLNDLIGQFACKQNGSFLLLDLYEFIRRKEKKFNDLDRLYALTRASEWAFETMESSAEDIFMPRHVFFKNAEFRITPLESEVQNGYLVPGHRFIPFISRAVFPADATLKLPDGSRAPTRIIRLPFQEATAFILFHGRYGMLDYLMTDNEANSARLVPPYDQPLEITVFDLQDFYSQCGFKPGDSLMLKTEDWLKGVFSVRHIPAAGNIDLAATREWTDSLRSGLEDALDESALHHDCDEQFALMFWIASRYEDAYPVLENPPLSVSAFFNMQKDLSMQTHGQISFLWPKDRPLEERLQIAMENSMDAEDEEEGLNFFFKQLGVSVSSEEAEAYMRDALGGGETDAANVLQRVISGRELHFASTADRKEFDRLWKELWTRVSKTYNPATDPCRKLRSVFLELNDQCLQVLRQLDSTPRDPAEILSNPATMQLGELSSLISSTLCMCNHDDEDAGAFNTDPDHIARDLSAAITDLAGQLGVNRAPRRLKITLPGKRKKTAPEIFQLKISLKQARPPIWRRVLVPATIQLEELHAVIQAAFGWHNCHLHQFIDGRTYYMPDPQDDGWGMFDFETEDSRGIQLQNLLTREKSKITYEYDFGDSWLHEILLEKILPPDGNQPLPVCIKGKRACPPDDCGGMYGYYEMLETLDGPDDDEKEDLLEWLGGPLDPEEFDLEYANARVRKIKLRR